MRLFFYYFSFVLGLAAAFPAAAYLSRFRGLSRREAIGGTLAGFAAGVVGAALMAQIYNAALLRAFPGAAFTHSRVSLYGGLLFMPLIMLPAAKISKTDFYALMDSCTAGVYILLTFAKLGCFVYGCCGGGLPVQLIEAALTAVIVLIIFVIIKKSAFIKGGIYPLSLMLYGAARFFTQFLRYHEIAAERHYFLFMDFWQTLSAAAIMIGAVWLLYLKIAEKRRAVRT